MHALFSYPLITTAVKSCLDLCSIYERLFPHSLLWCQKKLRQFFEPIISLQVVKVKLEDIQNHTKKLWIIFCYCVLMSYKVFISFVSTGVLMLNPPKALDNICVFLE